jgi:two-component system alkaline phosphatase synthesis response regulator PhoP
MTRVLVVDDDPAVVKLVRMNLEDDGYEVVTASDGSEALDAVSRDKPDAVVCDLMMPVTDGFTVLRTLRMQPDTKKIPFVVLTAKTLPDDIRKAVEMGADRYITKPFDPRELLDALAELLS